MVKPFCYLIIHLSWLEHLASRLVTVESNLYFNYFLEKYFAFSTSAFIGKVTEKSI